MLVQWWNSFTGFIKDKNERYPELGIFAFVTILVISGFLIISSRNKIDVNEINNNLDIGYQQIEKSLLQNKATDSINLCKNLKTVFLYANGIKESKMLLASVYQKYFIVCYTIGIFFLSLSAVITFLVSKKGWDSSSRRRKGLLVTVAFYGIAFSTFPKLFDQETNYRRNYTDYISLSNCQLFLFKRLQPYFDRTTYTLSSRDSLELNNTMDTATKTIMQYSNIDFSLDRKPLEIDYLKISK